MLKNALKMIKGIINTGNPGARFFDAVKEGRADRVQSMVDKDRSLLEKPNRFGNFPLHGAATCGNLEVVKTLVNAGADTGCRNRMEWTPLHCGAIENHKEVVRFLVKSGADLEAADTLGQTALHWAAQKGCTDTARVLLEMGADVLARNKSGNTPLSLAKSGKRGDTVEIIKKFRPKHAD